MYVSENTCALDAGGGVEGTYEGISNERLQSTLAVHDSPYATSPISLQALKIKGKE